MKRSITTLFLICIVFCVTASAGNEGKSHGKSADANSVKMRAASPDANTMEMIKQRRMQMIRSKARLQEQKRKAPVATEEQVETRKQVVKHQQDFERQINMETLKHQKRVAMLNRIQQLAEEKGQTDKVAKVESLRAKENERYKKKIAGFRSKPKVEPVAAVPVQSEPNE